MKVRSREALAGPARSVDLPALYQRLNDDAAQLATVRVALATAYANGPYTCGPCGETFEYTTASDIDDYAALNRWIGRHERCDEPAGAQSPYATAMAIVNGLRP